MEKILLHFYRLIDNTNNIFLLSMLLINRLFQESILLKVSQNILAMNRFLLHLHLQLSENFRKTFKKRDQSFSREFLKSL